MRTAATVAHVDRSTIEFEAFRATITVDTYAAARMRAAALACKAELEICHEGMASPVLSLLGILALGIAPGSRVRIRARGADAQQAEESIRRILLARPDNP